MSLCLTPAFARYGFVAAAPANAHEHHDNMGYAIDAVALNTDHRDDHHDCHHHKTGDHHEDMPGNDTAPAEPDGMHVHAVASFTTVSGPSAIRELISPAVTNRAEQSVVRASGHFSLPTKPPRSLR